MQTKTILASQCYFHACCSSQGEHNVKEMSTRIRNRGVDRTFHEGGKQEQMRKMRQ